MPQALTRSKQSALPTSLLRSRYPDSSSCAQLRATAVPVSAASLPLPTGAATETTVAGVRTDLGTDGTTPPAVLGAGTGVRGWLRSIYEKLTGTLAVTGTFWQATQPVSGTVTANAGTGTLAVSLATAPTTPVTGTFWQATQPVSIATAPVTPITDNAGSLTVDAPVATPVFVRLSDGTAAIATLPVSLATAPTTPVTGTFWQATQPVSGTFFQAAQPVTDNAGSLTVDAPVGIPAFVRLSDGTAAIATLPVSLATAPTTPVTGTFWQATQPVSIATNTPDVTDRAARLLGVATLGAGTAEVGKLAAGVASIGTVVLTAETTKVIGTVRDADTNAYVIRNFIMDTPLASPSAEALISVTQWYNNAAVAATTTPAVVPAGKILAITAMRINTASLAAAGMVKVRIRVNTAGVAAVTSPLVCALQCGSKGAVAALQSDQVVVFPKPFLIPAGAGVGFTHQGYVGATATLQSFTTMDVWGYEYTA